MTTVTINDTAGEEAALAAEAQLASPSNAAKAGTTAAANTDVLNSDGSVTTTDSRGRKLTFKKLRSLDRFRAAGVLGEQSMNLPYMAMASVAFSVSKVDETPFGPLLSLREVEGLIAVLDDEGMEAVNSSYDRHFSVTAPSADDVRTLVGN